MVRWCISVTLLFVTPFIFPVLELKAVLKLCLCRWKCFLYQLIDQKVSVVSKFQKLKPQGFSENSLTRQELPTCRKVRFSANLLFAGKSREGRSHHHPMIPQLIHQLLSRRACHIHPPTPKLSLELDLSR